MLSKEEKERYGRHLILENFGEEAQLKLKAAKILVVGAGGLGCPALLYLSAAGVGTIGIADDDVVSISNLQRQVLFSESDLDTNKAKAAKNKLQEQNPHITLNTHSRITKENALEIIAQYDLVLDGSDNFSTRYLLNDACVILKKPLVYGAIYKFEGQVSVFNYKGGPTYRCLFPEPPAEGEMPACGEIGVLGVLPGLAGTWQAAEAIKIITDIGEPLSGRLLSFDLLSNSISIFEFSVQEENKIINNLEQYETMVCELYEIDVLSLKKLQAQNAVQLIDVREAFEYAEKNLNGINIPISTLENRMNEINPKLKTIVHCKSGMRSKKAVRQIQKRFPEIEIYNLKDPF
jgi:sulfur-carrier protein adenylyltransferase/sulfurtransferase